MLNLLAFGAADAITLGIACVGAVTGIAALALNIYQFIISGPRVRVETEPARLGPHSRITGGKWDSHLDDEIRAAHPHLAIVVHAVNAGRMPTIIASWGIDIGDGMVYRSLNGATINRDLPTKIEAGERISFFVDLAEVADANSAAVEVLDAKREVHGVVTLSDGTSIRDKKPLAIPGR